MMANVLQAMKKSVSKADNGQIGTGKKYNFITYPGY